MTVRIVTDSCSDLPAEAAQTNGITVVPLYVIIGGETYKDGVDITPDDFYSRLVQLPKPAYHFPTLRRRLSGGLPTIAGRGPSNSLDSRQFKAERDTQLRGPGQGVAGGRGAAYRGGGLAARRGRTGPAGAQRRPVGRRDGRPSRGGSAG